MDTSLITDDIRELFTLTNDGSTWTLNVALIEWLSPHQPTMRYTPVAQWDAVPSPVAVEEHIYKTAQNKTFFRVCKTCKLLHSVGHMHSKGVCQSCAERYLGVVH